MPNSRPSQCAHTISNGPRSGKRCQRKATGRGRYCSVHKTTKPKRSNKIAVKNTNTTVKKTNTTVKKLKPSFWFGGFGG